MNRRYLILLNSGLKNNHPIGYCQLFGLSRLRDEINNAHMYFLCILNQFQNRILKTITKCWEFIFIFPQP